MGPPPPRRREPAGAIAALRAVAPSHIKDGALVKCLRLRDPERMKRTIQGWWAAPAQWWRRLPASETDPISLEPLRSLRKAPFVLVEADGHEYRFDGRCLAAYLVSSNVFVNPLNRRPLTASACEALDAHLVSQGLGEAKVARALALSGDVDAARERERAALRAESGAGKG